MALRCQKVLPKPVLISKMIQPSRVVAHVLSYLAAPLLAGTHSTRPAAVLRDRASVTGDLAAPAPDLMSFAAITDEPPAEVAAAGHDRCIIPIRPEHVDAWLNPDPVNLAAQHAILDDRARPFYEHRIAA